MENGAKNTEETCFICNPNDDLLETGKYDSILGTMSLSVCDEHDREEERHKVKEMGMIPNEPSGKCQSD